MASKTPAHTSGNNALSLGFSFLAGAGMTLMILGAAIGVIGGADADSSLIGILFAAGALMFISGLAAWLTTVRPWEHFDDISVPKYHGHHHPDADHLDDHRIELESGATAILPETTTQ